MYMYIHTYIGQCYIIHGMLWYVVLVLVRVLVWVWVCVWGTLTSPVCSEVGLGLVEQYFGWRFILDHILRSLSYFRCGHITIRTCTKRLCPYVSASQNRGSLRCWHFVSRMHPVWGRHTQFAVYVGGGQRIRQH